MKSNYRRIKQYILFLRKIMKTVIKTDVRWLSEKYRAILNISRTDRVALI
jgi:hypothetical protein